MGYSAHTKTGVGIRSQAGGRNSPVSFNRILSGKQFWDGRVDSLEAQAVGPIQNPIEMGFTHEGVVKRLSENPVYKKQFDAIFGELTIDRVGQAIAAFERECTWRGVPPVTTTLHGTSIILWRGVPIVPCDKLEVKSRYGSNQSFGTTSIVLVRIGEADQGVVGLHQTGIPGEIMPSLSARLMGLDSLGVASYLLTNYFSLAVLTDDALGVLENVEGGYYHDYEHRTSTPK